MVEDDHDRPAGSRSARGLSDSQLCHLPAPLRRRYQNDSKPKRRREDMNAHKTLVERLTPLLTHRPLGEQLFVIALLESRSGDRYREWAAQVSLPEIARGLANCAQREDEIAARIRSRFAGILAQPADFAELARAIETEVVALFAGHSREEQFQIQAEAERGGERLWLDLAEAESDAANKALLRECAELEAGSARFLESLSPATK
jgi:hypothetical protein